MQSTLNICRKAPKQDIKGAEHRNTFAKKHINNNLYILNQTEIVLYSEFRCCNTESRSHLRGKPPSGKLYRIMVLDETLRVVKSVLKIADYTKIVFYPNGLSELKGDDGKNTGTGAIIKHISKKSQVKIIYSK